MTSLTRSATEAELAWVAAPAVRTHVVASASELLALANAEPWRVRVTERGEAAILGRWREHGLDCAVLGLWCSARRVPFLVGDLLDVAREQGFDRLVGPLVPEREAGAYLEAGLRTIERVVVMLARPQHARSSGDGAPKVLTIRDATSADLGDLMELDAACFDPFWHYDMASLARLAREERMAVGIVDGRIVGYTLSTLRTGEASLGRLAVAAGSRRRGIGRALATEALGWLAGNGASRVVLSTQEDNTASRALYRGIGFRETGDVLVACASGRLSRPGRSPETGA